MSTDQVEEDLKIVVDDCDRIIEILNQRNTGDTFTDTSNRSWPYIKLNGHDVARISDILKGCAKIVSNIRRFSDSLKEPYITISQDVLNFHSNAFQFIMREEQGQVFESDSGQIWNFVNQLKLL